MDCDNTFDYNALNNLSKAKEFFMTDFCVNNKLKLATFIMGILLWGSLLLIGIYLAIHDIVKKKWNGKFNYKRKNITAVIVSSLGQFITYFLYLYGVQNRYRYFAYFICGIPIKIITRISLMAWFQSVNQIFTDVDNKIKYRVVIAIRVMDVITFLNISSALIGCIITFDVDNRTVNWFYSFWISFTSLVGVGLCVTLIYLGTNLLLACSPPDSPGITEDPKISELKYKIGMMVKVCKMSIGSQFILIFFPIWMYGTELGLPGVFYFHFFFYEPFIFFCVGLILWYIVIHINDKSTSSLNRSGDTSGKRISVHPVVVGSESKNEIAHEMRDSYAM